MKQPSDATHTAEPLLPDDVTVARDEIHTLIEAFPASVLPSVRELLRLLLHVVTANHLSMVMCSWSVLACL